MHPPDRSDREDDLRRDAEQHQPHPLHTAADLRTRAAEIAARSPAGDPAYDTIAKRLWQIFGPGDNPTVRRTLFERLQREATLYGPPVYAIIAAAVASARSARTPDRYFVATVTRRLREAGHLMNDSHLPPF